MEEEIMDFIDRKTRETSKEESIEILRYVIEECYSRVDCYTLDLELE